VIADVLRYRVRRIGRATWLAARHLVTVIASMMMLRP